MNPARLPKAPRSTGSGPRARRRTCPSGSLAAGANIPVLKKIAEHQPRLKLHIDHPGRGGGGSGITHGAAFADLLAMLALA